MLIASGRFTAKKRLNVCHELLDYFGVVAGVWVDVFESFVARKLSPKQERSLKNVTALISDPEACARPRADSGCDNQTLLRVHAHFLKDNKF